MDDHGTVLVVDPGRTAVAMFEEALGDTGVVDVCTDFGAARARLLEGAPDLLVTNFVHGSTLNDFPVYLYRGGPGGYDVRRRSLLPQRRRRARQDRH